MHTTPTTVRYCTKQCTHPNQHQPQCETPETCPGCKPRHTQPGSLLCTNCEHTLTQHLADAHQTPESLAWIHQWLGDNLGQHLHHLKTLGGRHTGTDARMERLTSIIQTRRNIETATLATAKHLARHLRIPPPNTQNSPLEALTWLRVKETTLRRWKPVTDTLNQFNDLKQTAHTLAPWRATHHPNADEQAATLCYQAQPQPTQIICEMFAITQTTLRKAKQRGKLTPTNQTKPNLWRPWDVFAWKHPAEATNYLTQWATTHNPPPNTQNSNSEALAHPEGRKPCGTP